MSTYSYNSPKIEQNSNRLWRRGWDSNPRYGNTVYLNSNQAPSSTRPPLPDAATIPIPVFGSPAALPGRIHCCAWAVLPALHLRESQDCQRPTASPGLQQRPVDRKARHPGTSAAFRREQYRRRTARSHAPYRPSQLCLPRRSSGSRQHSSLRHCALNPVPIGL